MDVPVPGKCIIGSTNGEVSIWDLASRIGNVIQRPSKARVVSIVSDVVDMDSVRICYSDGIVKNYSLEHGSVKDSMRMVFTADGFLFDSPRVYIWEDQTVQVWDESTGQSPMERMSLGSRISTCMLAKDSQTLFAACADKSIKVWRVGDPMPSIQLTGQGSQVTSFDFCGEHNLVSGASNRTVCLWDIRQTSQPINTLKYHQSAVRSVKSISSNMFISGDNDEILVWSINGNDTPTLLTSLQVGMDEVLSVLTADQSSIMAGLQSGIVKRYDFTVYK
eukprot:gene3847-4442_t